MRYLMWPLYLRNLVPILIGVYAAVARHLHHHGQTAEQLAIYGAVIAVAAWFALRWLIGAFGSSPAQSAASKRRR